MKIQFEFMSELIEIRKKIDSLSDRREEIVSSNSDVILDKVYQMMDWRKNDIKFAKVEYSSFEKRIMIEVCVKFDIHARYVFELNGKSELKLRFREDYSKWY